MDIDKRIEMVALLIDSIKESITEFNGNKFDCGCNYPSEHSVTSIQDRCRVARRELLLIMKELNKCY